MMRSLLCLAGLSAAAMMAFAGAAEAGKCKGRACRGAPYADEGYRYIKAEATIGGKTVVAPVRAGEWGDQVRTPAGNWYDCEITCEYISASMWTWTPAMSIAADLGFSVAIRRDATLARCPGGRHWKHGKACPHGSEGAPSSFFGLAVDCCGMASVPMSLSQKRKYSP
jgi:hypothetical protein